MLRFSLAACCLPPPSSPPLPCSCLHLSPLPSHLFPPSLPLSPLFSPRSLFLVSSLSPLSLSLYPFSSLFPLPFFPLSLLLSPLSRRCPLPSPCPLSRVSSLSSSLSRLSPFFPLSPLAPLSPLPFPSSLPSLRRLLHFFPPPALPCSPGTLAALLPPLEPFAEGGRDVFGAALRCGGGKSAGGNRLSWLPTPPPPPPVRAFQVCFLSEVYIAIRVSVLLVLGCRVCQSLPI